MLGIGPVAWSAYQSVLNYDPNANALRGCIVAFTEGLEYRVTKFGGYKSLFFSGEGLVCQFSGQGKVWIQTRQVNAFARWVFPFRPEQNNG